MYKIYKLKNLNHIFYKKLRPKRKKLEEHDDEHYFAVSNPMCKFQKNRYRNKQNEEFEKDPLKKTFYQTAARKSNIGQRVTKINVLHL